jgi:hypothetical protein
METKDTTMVSLRLTTEELQTIDARAAQAGMNRTEYMRARIFSSDDSETFARLEKQLNALTDRLGREADRQEARKCSNPEHKRIYGVGHCFDCDLPINSQH